MPPQCPTSVLILQFIDRLLLEMSKMWAGDQEYMFEFILTMLWLSSQDLGPSLDDVADLGMSDDEDG